MTVKPKIAIVVPGIAYGGGVPSVAMFLRKVLINSGRYQPELISIAVSSTDATSARLLSMGSWFQGVQTRMGEWQGVPFIHVGCHLAEIECARYLPRSRLTQLLNSFALIQVVSGTPMFGLAVDRVQRPKCITVGTTIIQDRGSSLDEGRGPKNWWRKVMTRGDIAIERFVLPRMDHVFAQSDYTRELLQLMVPGSRLSMGWPGVDTSVFHPATPRKGDYVLSVARFSDPRKNVGMLFRAYAALRERLPLSPRLVLAGSAGPSPSDWAIARNLGLSEHVEFREKPSVEELAQLYRDAALFALSSNEEGFGIVLLEAMASGIPVVATKCGGPETAVSYGETGYLTPVGNSEEMAKRMQELLTDRELNRRMGERARRVAEQRFSVEATGRAYLEVFDRLLS